MFKGLWQVLAGCVTLPWADLRAWARSARRRPAKRPRRTLLRLEGLEERWTPATDVWTGGGGSVSGSWELNMNWSLGRPPSPTDDVVFDGNQSEGACYTSASTGLN